MKQLLYSSILLIVVSCKREPLTTYNTADNVYFNYNLGFSHYVDSMDFSFASSNASVKDTILLLPLAVTGAPVATDRTFKLVVDPASTAQAGTHYELPELLIHAGKVQDTLRLRVKRTADLAAGVKKLILHLQPNERFKTDLGYRVVNNVAPDTVDLLTFSINASDMLSAGRLWNSTYAAYFGAFSIKKVKLINSLFGMPLDFWTIAPSQNDPRRSDAIYYATSMSRYLADQAIQGNIITDEDGTPMQMGPAYR